MLSLITSHVGKLMKQCNAHLAFGFHLFNPLEMRWGQVKNDHLVG